GSEKVTSSIARMVIRFANRELDPDSSLFLAAMRWAENLSPQSTTVATVYLFAHGIIKVILVVALLSRKIWAYPTAIIILLLFMVYEMQRIYTHHSIMLSVAAVLDAAVVVLIYREFRSRLNERRRAG